ncbi:hypothetical protein [Myxococcus fulvus]|uniref:hypothetical protein n=1 Tax=Myxococcus fulvus TaxID=33 RepID=UPI000943CB82|nr:hypothetical protein [Myxococcus fulvus]
MEAVCAVVLLEACGAELDAPPAEVPRGNVGWEMAAESVPTPLLATDRYADAVAPTTTVGVLQPGLALGAPDERGAVVLGLLGGALVLDMGADEAGTGDLKVHYRGLVVSVLTWVDFLRSDGSVIASGPLTLVDLEAGVHTALVPYLRERDPYRYVRLNGGLALYQVDAVESSGLEVGECGDGRVDGDENCDDGDIEPGDGCGVDCRWERGYTCDGEPSHCEDINECLDPSDNDCSWPRRCVNNPGGYTCEDEEPCPPPNQVCENVCTDVESDEQNCGRCGQNCRVGEICQFGQCRTGLVPDSIVK